MHPVFSASAQSPTAPQTIAMSPTVANAWNGLTGGQKESILKAFSSFGVQIFDGKITCPTFHEKGLRLLNATILELSLSLTATCDLNRERILAVIAAQHEHTVSHSNDSLQAQIAHLPNHLKKALQEKYPGLPQDQLPQIEQDLVLCRLFGAHLKRENLGCSFANFEEKSTVFTKAKDDFLRVKTALFTEQRLPFQHMYIHGPSGVGKTHFTMSMIKELIPLLKEGWSIFYLPINPNKSAAINYMTEIDKSKTIFVVDDLQLQTSEVAIDFWARLTRSMHETGGERFLISSSNYDILEVLTKKKMYSGNFDDGHAALRRMTQNGVFYDFALSPHPQEFVQAGYVNHGQKVSAQPVPAPTLSSPAIPTPQKVETVALSALPTKLSKRQVSLYFSQGPLSKFRDAIPLMPENCCQTSRINNRVVFNYTYHDVQLDGAVVKVDGRMLLVFPQTSEWLLVDKQDDKFVVYFLGADGQIQVNRDLVLGGQVDVIGQVTTGYNTLVRHVLFRSGADIKGRDDLMMWIDGRKAYIFAYYGVRPTLNSTSAEFPFRYGELKVPFGYKLQNEDAQALEQEIRDDLSGHGVSLPDRIVTG